MSKEVKTRCASVKTVIDHAGDCPHRVKKMLAKSLQFTVGIPSENRHPFSERFVMMIEQVLASENASLKGIVATKETAFSELTPAKAGREAALESAKAHAAEQGALLGDAKRAVTDANAAVKSAVAELKAAKKAQHDGDAELEATTATKTGLEAVVRDALTPLVEGADEESRFDKSKLVVDTGRSFGFDSSLMQTAATLFQKPASERGVFDGTCIQQIQEAFAAQVAKYEAELAAGAPGKAERAGTVDQAEAAKHAAESSLADVREKAAAAQESKAAADVAAKAAAKSLADFMPDLKASGDALDAASKALQAFIEGPQAAFGELKTFKEDDFKPVKKARIAIEPAAPEQQPATEPIA